MTTVRLTDLRKSYDKLEILHGINLDIKQGEFVVFVGPSGCGKSTLLRTIAGLELSNSGTIEIDGVDVTNVDASLRGVAMVFQSYALYPHMTVADNMGFGLKMAGRDKAEIKRRVDEAARILQLEPLLERFPKQLSGGQRQRVAIGRAIVRNPKVFLFDEPLSNLDAELRVQMRIEIARLHSQMDATMIYVTHDQVEAMTLADKIVVLEGGHVRQFGAPLDLYDDPANQFVAGFIGSPKMNFLKARSEGNTATGLKVTVEGFGDQTLEIPGIKTAVAQGSELTLGIRPEHFLNGADAGEFSTDLPVAFVENLGESTFVYANLAGGTQVTAELRDNRLSNKVKSVTLGIPANKAFLFTPDEERLR
ncbi:sn-glycerol-3-phosphate ABC transporter ATP-binding protein UgpC [Pseudovibrio exalbescens]|uniref:ABC transporter ATP-binding protein n=1 Tax=Pseudovibrio exalbescens TaxID=197461 RepID=UPI00236571C7|nr:sn-glycerol-3-phosphate ABC transporter ATP-binding protein UgpC [Pseudovibrio exalbescens]MDD7911417.1 sn-glycerol-3-phosphate ABC transporter ATP-binding protein UgpC [Pseudovibrio exalbescens]